MLILCFVYLVLSFLNFSSNINNAIPTLYLASVFTQFLMNVGGAGEDRTPDPLRARQVLSQLSYDPIKTDEHNLSNLIKRTVRALWDSTSES